MVKQPPYLGLFNPFFFSKLFTISNFRYASDEKVRQDVLRDMQKQIDEEIKDKSSQHDSRLKQVGYLNN